MDLITANVVTPHIVRKTLDEVRLELAQKLAAELNLPTRVNRDKVEVFLDRHGWIDSALATCD